MKELNLSYVVITKDNPDYGLLHSSDPNKALSVFSKYRKELGSQLYVLNLKNGSKTIIYSVDNAVTKEDIHEINETLKTL